MKPTTMEDLFQLIGKQQVLIEKQTQHIKELERARRDHDEAKAPTAPPA